MVAWHHADRWAMVVLRPGEIPVIADPKLYLEAAADFEHGASPEDALLAFDAAVKRWPSEAVAWIGRGTAQYRAGKLAEASQDYAAALRVDAGNAGARNNLAQTLLELGCPASRPRATRVHRFRRTSVAIARGRDRHAHSCRRRGIADLRRQSGLRIPVSGSWDCRQLPSPPLRSKFSRRRPRAGIRLHQFTNFSSCAGDQWIFEAILSRISATVSSRRSPAETRSAFERCRSWLQRCGHEKHCTAHRSLSGRGRRTGSDRGYRHADRQRDFCHRRNDSAS